MSDPRAQAAQPQSTNPAKAPAAPAGRSWRRAVLVLALLLVALGVGGYLYLRARVAEVERDKALVEKQAAEARAAAETAEAQCRADLEVRAAQAKSCEANLQLCRASAHLFMGPAPVPTKAPELALDPAKAFQ